MRYERWRAKRTDGNGKQTVIESKNGSETDGRTDRRTRTGTGAGAGECTHAVGRAEREANGQTVSAPEEQADGQTVTKTAPRHSAPSDNEKQPHKHRAITSAGGKFHLGRVSAVASAVGAVGAGRGSEGEAEWQASRSVGRSRLGRLRAAGLDGGRDAAFPHFFARVTDCLKSQRISPLQQGRTNQAASASIKAMVSELRWAAERRL